MRFVRLARLMVVIALSAFLPSRLATQEVRYRKNVDDMTATEWAALAEAINALHQKDQGMDQNPTPVNQPLDSYEYFVKVHGSVAKPQWGCEHVSELIWPWHRAFLLHFENALNAVRKPGSPVITLPYWDWTDTATGQNGYPQPYEDSQIGLVHPRRAYPKQSFSGSPLDIASGFEPGSSKQFIEKLLAAKSWTSFGGTAKSATFPSPGDLELQAHNSMHGYIGIDNATTRLSVRDPVFWAHHANLDRLVAEWQKLHSDQPQCNECDAIAYQDPTLGDLTFKKLLSDDALPAPGGGTLKVVYVPKGGAVPAALQSDFLNLSVPQRLTFLFTIPEFVGYHVRLRIEGVSVPREMSYKVSAFVAKRRTQISGAVLSKYQLVTVTQFAVGHEGESADSAHRHNPVASTISLDVTDKLSRIAAKSARGDEYMLIIVFESADPDKSYSDVQREIHFRRIRLVREDFATQQDIQLTRLGDTK